VELDAGAEVSGSAWSSLWHGGRRRARRSTAARRSAAAHGARCGAKISGGVGISPADGAQPR